jgi:plastocyanin
MCAAVSRASIRFVTLTFCLALAVAACGQVRPAFEDPLAGVERRFVPQVADSLGDVGRGVSVAVDPDGNPHLVYVGLTQPVVEGALPETRPITAPAVPAILHADLVGGIWTRDAVVQDEQQVSEESTTGIAVDGDGVHHVVWTEPPSGLFYSSDQAGQFSEKEAITREGAFGISIAVGQSGVPWVSWYDGGTVKAATGSGGAWTVEEVASGIDVETAEDLKFVTSIRVGSDGQPLLAFTDAAPMLARRQSGGWVIEAIDGAEASAISLALDADGNPHVAYYAGSEVVHAHSIGGGPWETSTVGTFTLPTASPTPTATPTPTASPTATGTPTASATPTVPPLTPDVSFLSTGIAVDSEGVHYVTWYDGEGNRVRFATNEGGSFEEAQAPGTESGAIPVIAAVPDGSNVYVAWYDTALFNVQLGVYGSGELVLAQPGETAPAPVPTATASPTGPAPECPAGGLEIAAPPGAATNGFNTATLEAPGGEPITICFDNQEAGVPHNVEISSQEGDTSGDVFAPPDNATITGPAFALYDDVGELDGGSYFYYCFVHPTTMTGTLTVG